jgi:hypothetical protein
MADGLFYADGFARDAYRWLPANQRIFPDCNGLAAAATYQAVIDAERNPQLFSNAAGIRPARGAMHCVIDMDDPQHLMRRKLADSQAVNMAVPNRNRRSATILHATVVELRREHATLGHVGLVRHRRRLLRQRRDGVVLGPPLGRATQHPQMRDHSGTGCGNR